MENTDRKHKIRKNVKKVAFALLTGFLILYYSHKYQSSGKTRRDTEKNEHDAFTQKVKS